MWSTLMSGPNLILARPTLRTLSLVALCALAAGCDQGQPPPAAPDAAAETRIIGAIVSFDELGGPVRDLALAPNEAEPWRGRILALVGEDLAILDLDAETAVRRPIGAARALSVAPNFSLRGVAAPLILTGGEDGLKAHLFLREDDEIVAAPLDLTAGPSGVLGLCDVRADASGLTVHVVTRSDEGAGVWRVRDTGGELLTLETLGRAEGEDADRCARSARSGESGTSRLDVSSLAQGPTDVALFDGGRIAAAPQSGGLEVVLDARAPVAVSIRRALNAAGKTAPEHVAASTANFGGSFSGGVAAVAQGDSVSVLALDDLVRLVSEPAPETDAEG